MPLIGYDKGIVGSQWNEGHSHRCETCNLGVAACFRVVYVQLTKIME